MSNRAPQSDRVELREFQRRLGTIDLDGPPAFEVIAQALMPLLRTHSTLVYSASSEEGCAGLDGFALAGHGAPMANVLASGLDEWIRRSSGAWAHFDPRSPEPVQRNVVLPVGTMRQLASSKLPAMLERARVDATETERRVASIASARPWFQRWDAVDAEQLRSLVCEGPTLLAWVGALQPERFDKRAARMLAAALPSIHRRLWVDARLHNRGGDPLVAAVLEELGTAAYVLDARDRVVSTNVAGRERLRRDQPGIASALTTARRNAGDTRYVVTELSARGVPGHALALERVVVHDPGRRVDVLARRYGLTPRESQVLAVLTGGKTNRAIAVQLRISERTVETHLSRILAKTDCASRAELVGLVWTSAT